MSPTGAGTSPGPPSTRSSRGSRRSAACSAARGCWPALSPGWSSAAPVPPLFGELVAAVVEMALGNSGPGSTVVSGLLEGLGVEIVLALFLYRRFGPVVRLPPEPRSPRCVEVVFESVEYYSAYSIGWKLAYAAIFAVSGAVVAGVGGWLLTRALAETGALTPFPPGQEVARSAGDLSAVRLRGLTWTPAGRRAPVLAGLDLDIPSGQRVLLAGPSGAGKSTLLRAHRRGAADRGHRGAVR